MNFYPVWPILAVFFGLFWLARLRLFAAADTPPTQQVRRLQTIDGLRGYLALGVMLHHAAIYHLWLRDGVWNVPPSRTYTILGTAGVAVFFMITGYLFWGGLIDKRGRMDWARLYLGRLFRIAPLYLFAILAMVVLVMMHADWHLKVPFGEFLNELAPWLALGLLTSGDLNGHPATMILTAGVTWSLRYEWIFYLSLPILAVAAGRGAVRTAIVLVVLATAFYLAYVGRFYFLSPMDLTFVTLFLIGMACASLDRHDRKPRINDIAASSIVVAMLAILFLTCSSGYSPRAIALLGISFYLVISGCTLFGILTHRASRRLGNISYGIYLLQGLVLAVLFQSQIVRSFALVSPVRHWAIILLGSAVLLGIATITHAWIERPGVVLGKRLARRLPTAAPDNISGVETTSFLKSKQTSMN